MGSLYLWVGKSKYLLCQNNFYAKKYFMLKDFLTVHLQSDKIQYNDILCMQQQEKL